MLVLPVPSVLALRDDTGDEAVDIGEEADVDAERFCRSTTDGA